MCINNNLRINIIKLLHTHRFARKATLFSLRDGEKEVFKRQILYGKTTTHPQCARCHFYIYMLNKRLVALLSSSSSSSRSLYTIAQKSCRGGGGDAHSAPSSHTRYLSANKISK